MSATLALVGDTALIGVSNDAPSTAHIPNAHREALVALELADVSQRVSVISAIPLRRLLLHFGREQCNAYSSMGGARCFSADEGHAAALLATLAAYADADLNVLKLPSSSPCTEHDFLRLQRVRELTAWTAFVQRPHRVTRRRRLRWRELAPT